MSEEQEDIEVPTKKYKLEPPDGGWGYVILISVSVYHALTLMQPNSFGLIYGTFLSSLGDETSQTGLVCGIYFTLQMLSGCVTNFLLRKYSYRKVGLFGSGIYLIGSVGVIFVENFIQLIICFGILQGIGSGFMLGAVYCSFESYFQKKLRLMMGLVQITNGLGIMFMPYLSAVLVKNLSFRNTLIALVGIALINVVNMFALLPVKHHMKKVYIGSENGSCNNGRLQQKRYIPDEKEQDTLLTEKINKTEIGQFEKEYNFSSVVVNTEDKKNISFIDFDLLKTLKFWNISSGLALGCLADFNFCALVPVLLSTIGFELNDIAFMITVDYGCDLVGRIFFVIYARFFKFRCKTVFLTGSILMIIFRTVFLLHNTYRWRLVTLGITGFIRCMVMSTLVAVLSEEFEEQFPSAFTLNMVENGIVALIYGGLGSFIKTATGRDDMVVHLLSAGNFLCVFCWSTELFYRRLRNKSINKLQK